MTTFSHPLARDAKVWRSGGLGGEPQNVLVVITTLTLDPQNKRFKAEKVERLSTAVRDWIADSQGAAHDFVLINRAKDWAD